MGAMTAPAVACLPSRAAREAARTGLYVHVPFCAVRCHYCDFATGPLSHAGLQRWLAAFERECALRAPLAAGVAFSSVFFGGGTPSALSARDFARVWRALTGHFTLAADAEITLEANPESVRAPLLAAWVAAGVNRLSMGVQSLVPDELARLGRIHDAARPAVAVSLARAHGIRNLSLDVMFGFPGHDEEAFGRTLAGVLALEPEHLSAYCYIPESGTPMGDAVARGAVALPPHDVQAACYARLAADLGAAGYACYETSNFARPGAEARHNLVYWLRRPYLGLGPSAHSHWDGARWGNHRDGARWALALEAGEPPEAEREHPDPATADGERLMLALRLSTGLDPADWPEADGQGFLARHRAALDHAVATGRLERHGGAWRVPEHHRFVADDVIAWVAARATRG
jgi:putative oxygen-independent coproporphyrinogen III oxidase